MASPLLNFALIGRKSSGKTCLLSALATARESNPSGINCDLSRSKERYENYLLQNHVKEFFKLENNSAIPYSQMLEHISSIEKDLQNNKLPNATPLSGKTAYIFNFDTQNKLNFDIGIFDYAGELIEAESKISEDLLKFLGKMSGLLILVEVNDDTPEAIRQAAIDITNLKRFFKAIKTDDQSTTRFNVPIALLVTKFDKYQKLDYDKYYNDGQNYLEPIFGKFLESKQGKNIKELISSIKNTINDELFKVFPVCAFGNVKENNELDIPLQSINVLEPILWATKSFAKLSLKNVTQSLTIPNNKSSIAYLKELKQEIAFAFDLFSNDDPDKNIAKDLINQTEELINEKSKKEAVIAYSSMGCIAALLIGSVVGTEFFIDYNRILKIKKETVTLDNIEANKNWLSNYASSAPYRHLVSNFCFFSKNEAFELKNNFEKQHDELYWVDANQTLDDITKLDKLDKYLQLFPNAIHSNEAQTTADNIFYQLAVNAPNETEKVAKYRNYLKQFPNGIHTEDAKKTMEETAYNIAINMPNDAGRIEKLKAYLLEFSYGPHLEEARKKLDEFSFNLGKNEPDVDKMVELLKSYKQNFANGNHIDEADEIIKNAKFLATKNAWFSLADEAEKHIIALRTTNSDIDEESFKKASQYVARLKSTNNESFNSEKRFIEIEESFKEVIIKINQKKIDIHKKIITEAMDSNQTPDYWLEGLRLTIELKNDTTIKLSKEAWIQFAGDIVITKLYENFKLYVQNDNIDFDAKIKALNNAKNSSYRTQIMDIISYANNEEKIWFEKLIYQTQTNNIENILRSNKVKDLFTAAKQCSDLYGDIQSAKSIKIEWEKFAARTCLYSIFNKLKSISESTELFNFDDNIKILNEAKSDVAISNIINNLPKELRKNYTSNEFEVLISNTTKKVFKKEYNFLVTYVKQNGYKLESIISNQSEILRKIKNLTAKFGNNSYIYKNYPSYLEELKKYEEFIYRIKEPKQVTYWVSTVTWPIEHKIRNAKRKIHVSFGNSVINFKIEGGEKTSNFIGQQALQSTVEVIPDDSSIGLRCEILDETTIARTDFTVENSGSISSIELLTNQSPLKLDLIGKVEGMLIDDIYKGSITINTKSDFKITPLRSIQ